MSFYKNILFLLFLCTFSTQIETITFKGFYQSANLSKTRDYITAKMAYAVSKASSYVPAIFSHTPEQALFLLSQVKANYIFWKAYKQVPAYKDFVNNHRNNELPKTFADIPVTSKVNYIKHYPMTQTLVFGQLPLQGQIDTSTGTSGTPTKWIRSHKEMEEVKSWIRIASQRALGDKPYLFCNMFALGPWATGMTSTYALTGTQLILSIGPDLDKLYDVLKDFGPEQRYVIAGYPPHMKKFVDNAPFDLRSYDITMVVGGEAMSENVYQSLINKGIKEVYSSYGASDLRINIGQQTKFEQELQRICQQDSNLKKELLGTTEGTPLFFHYNPLLDYIEEGKDGNLLFTDLDEHRASPRVRYDLGDKGKILKISTVVNLLKKHGYKLTPRTNLPLLCLYGRGDDALTFNGANLMYDDLERALAKIPGLYEKINRYAYNKFENKNLDQQLEFWIELKKDVSLNDVDATKLNQEIIAQLSTINQDFKAQVEYLKNNKDSQLPFPTTYMYEFGKSPMVAQSGHHKNKYVYNMPSAN